jgi:hypothetical protein
VFLEFFAAFASALERSLADNLSFFGSLLLALRSLLFAFLASLADLSFFLATAFWDLFVFLDCAETPPAKNYTYCDQAQQCADEGGFRVH